MRLEATPVAASWDDRPGPDGLEVRVHFFHPGSRLPLAVNGRLEFILYEGLVADEDLDKANPFYSWKFTGQTLRPYLSLSAVGWGYVLRLAWGANAPTTSAVTLTAVYYPPSGPPVRDRAISIAVQSR
jgi:hypothetical protein